MASSPTIATGFTRLPCAPVPGHLPNAAVRSTILRVVPGIERIRVALLLVGKPYENGTPRQTEGSMAL
jgi:hypothetical protein